MKKILVVFGTRPEAVKMAPVVKALESRRDVFESRTCVTAQHRSMLDQILQVFEIEPHYDLDIMTSKQDLYDITSNVLAGMRSVLADYRPDLLIVQGDTTTTFAASLAAFYERIHVAHVEAGLRTGDIYAPYPEEINRQLSTRIARYHFAPTTVNEKNLLAENVSSDAIVVTGNTVIDALLMVVERLRNDADRSRAVLERIGATGLPPGVLEKKQSVVLVTGHRRESFGEGFVNICQALRDIAAADAGRDIVYPVHLNPNVREPVRKILSGIDNVHLIEPLAYEEFVYLMDRAHLILTDSGGIQEEAPALGKPTLVMRNNTERPEAIEAGTAALVGTDRQTIVTQVERLLGDSAAYDEMANARNPYGDGSAGKKILQFLLSAYGVKS